MPIIPGGRALTEQPESGPFTPAARIQTPDRICTGDILKIQVNSPRSKNDDLTGQADSRKHGTARGVDQNFVHTGHSRPALESDVNAHL